MIVIKLTYFNENCLLKLKWQMAERNKLVIDYQHNRKGIMKIVRILTRVIFLVCLTHDVFKSFLLYANNIKLWLLSSFQ